ncbi:MAG: TIGR00159 family protein [Proteobacteria bacterium]|nr:TIGR00159 family protein [Pseudomonadota bacterium]
MFENPGEYTALLRNAIDIALVAYIIYRGLLLIRGTRAAPMLAGLAVLVALYFLATQLGFITLGWLLSNILSSIILVVVVLFQDDIRRVLTKVGMRPLLRRSLSTSLANTVEEISVACRNLSDKKLGALIIVQREVGLDQFIEDGTTLNAAVNRKLLLSLFVKESALHDGAVVIEGDSVKAAGCLLPLSLNPDLDPNLGTRHRAALGVSEQSDCVAIVVSEQNGSISVAREGQLNQNLDPSNLREVLLKQLELPPQIASNVSPDSGGR